MVYKFILHIWASRLKGAFGMISLLLVVTVIGPGCEEENPQPTEDKTDEGSWLIYSPIDWSHDGEPVTGIHCKVYSDEASTQLKLQCLDFADKMFESVLSDFGFTDFNELILPPENDKINVYINAGHPENVAYAYWGTIFITVRTPALNTTLYKYLFKHELTHEFEFLIEGRVNLGTDVWFREGIAIYNGGGFNRIKTVADLDAWMRENRNFPGEGNPVCIHEWADFPAGSDIDRYYWYAFDLAMRYLLDNEMDDWSHNNILNLFRAVRDGNSFARAFHDNFGIELELFEQEFYSRAREYLKNSLPDDVDMTVPEWAL